MKNFSFVVCAQTTSATTPLRHLKHVETMPLARFPATHFHLRLKNERENERTKIVDRYKSRGRYRLKVNERETSRDEKKERKGEREREREAREVTQRNGNVDMRLARAPAVGQGKTTAVSVLRQHQCCTCLLALPACLPACLLACLLACLPACLLPS